MLSLHGVFQFVISHILFHVELVFLTLSSIPVMSQVSAPSAAARASAPVVAASEPYKENLRLSFKLPF